MKNDPLSQTATNYKAYKSLLVQNILASFEKCHFQEAKKDLQRCFSLENYQMNKVEMNILYNLCLSIIHYKKNEIKKLFLNMEEVLSNIAQVSFDKLSALFTQENYSQNLIKKLILKDVVIKKASLIIGLNLEEIASSDKSQWFKNTHTFTLFCNIIFALLLLQKNPLLNIIHKNSFIIWLDKFREKVSCLCDICSSKQIKNIFLELEILKNLIIKSSSTIVVNSDEKAETNVNFNKATKLSNKNLEFKDLKDTTLSKFFHSKSNNQTREPSNNTKSIQVAKSVSNLDNSKEPKNMKESIFSKISKKTNSSFIMKNEVSKSSKKDSIFNRNLTGKPGGIKNMFVTQSPFKKSEGKTISLFYI